MLSKQADFMYGDLKLGKRSSFQPRPQDKYFTPMAGVIPLLPHLPNSVMFAEPCAGDGRLRNHLEYHGHYCVSYSDINPDNPDIPTLDALDFRPSVHVEMIITNPPWSRPILHKMIEYLPTLRPTWLLFDADWAHTIQSAALIKTCSKIVSVGRLKWIEDSKYTGKDNCCWYLFEQGYTSGPKFFGRNILK